MKKLFIPILITLISCSLNAQNANFNKFNEEYPEQIDSMYYLTWDSGNSQWVSENIRHYKYNGNNLVQLLLLNAKNRDSVWLWTYFYDNNNNQNKDVLIKWSNGVSNYSQKKESVFINGNKITEEVFIWKNSNWVKNSFYKYNFIENLVDNAVYQIINKQGLFSDYQYIYYTYLNNFVSEVVTKRASDNVIVRIDDYYYENNLLSEIINKTLLKNPQSQVYELTNTQRRLYFYDENSLLREVHFQNWDGGNWVIAYKYVYYYKLDNAKKVCICHNGKTISVSINAISSHLGHGDYLGKCKIIPITPKKVFNSETPVVNNIITIFPNPTENCIIISSKNSDELIKGYEIYDLSGKLVSSSYNIKSSEIKVDINYIPSGVYIVNVYSNEIYQQKIIKQ